MLKDKIKKAGHMPAFNLKINSKQSMNDYFANPIVLIKSFIVLSRISFVN